MNRSTFCVIYILILFATKLFGYDGENFRGIILLALAISLFLYEIYERRKNIKNGCSRFHENIIVRKDKNCYLSMVLVLWGMIIVSTIFIMVTRQYNLQESIIIIMVRIALILLAIFYGYLYVISNQILYKDGLKLANNKFITKDHIDKVTYRGTLMSKKKIIEISLLSAAKVEANRIRVKCENEEELIKVIDILEEITGVKAENLEW